MAKPEKVSFGSIRFPVDIYTADGVDELVQGIADSSDERMDGLEERLDSNDERIGGLEDRLSSVYRYKGSVQSFSDLPTTGMEPGDVYNVEVDSNDAGMNYAWAEDLNDKGHWDPLGPSLAGYATKSYVNSGLDGKLNKSGGMTVLALEGGNNAGLVVADTAGVYHASYQPSQIVHNVPDSKDHRLEFPLKGGTLALTSDIPAVPVKSVKVNGEALTPDSNDAVDIAVPDATLSGISELSRLSAWTILRDGVDVTSQVQQPVFSDDGFDHWYIDNSCIPGDTPEGVSVEAGELATALSWLSLEGSSYTATRSPLPVYALGNQTEKPLPSKQYVDDALSGKYDKSGGTISGDVTISGSLLNAESVSATFGSVTTSELHMDSAGYPFLVDGVPFTFPTEIGSGGGTVAVRDDIPLMTHQSYGTLSLSMRKTVYSNSLGVSSNSYTFPEYDDTDIPYSDSFFVYRMLLFKPTSSTASSVSSPSTWTWIGSPPQASDITDLGTSGIIVIECMLYCRDDSPSPRRTFARFLGVSSAIT